ncbi:hypothetical protein, partial [Microbacterium sp. Mcb102]|uniref:hypothetical protein n=1 Tax=Microbacterium sp. Mcb102 TaxID=2926012 RepID=UPI0021C5F477
MLYAVITRVDDVNVPFADEWIQPPWKLCVTPFPFGSVTFDSSLVGHPSEPRNHPALLYADINEFDVTNAPAADAWIHPFAYCR